MIINYIMPHFLKHKDVNENLCDSAIKLPERIDNKSKRNWFRVHGHSFRNG